MYPSAFLERPRRAYTQSFPILWPINNATIDVHSPRLWGLPYENLEIQTSDNVILRCYLLRPQRTPELAGSADEASETRAILVRKLSFQKADLCLLWMLGRWQTGDRCNVPRKRNELRRFPLLC